MSSTSSSSNTFSTLLARPAVVDDLQNNSNSLFWTSASTNRKTINNACRVHFSVRPTISETKKNPCRGRQRRDDEEKNNRKRFLVRVFQQGVRWFTFTTVTNMRDNSGHRFSGLHVHQYVATKVLLTPRTCGTPECCRDLVVLASPLRPRLADTSRN